MKPIKYTPGMKIEVGNYYLDMPNDVYHAHQSVSKSSLTEFAKSPYKFFNKKYKAPTKSMVIGSAIHCRILEPDLYAKTFPNDVDFSECLSSDAAMKSWLKERGQINYAKLKTDDLIDFVLKCDESAKIKKIEESNWMRSILVDSFLPGDDEKAIFGVRSGFNEDGARVCVITDDNLELIDGIEKAVMANADARKYLNAVGYTEISGFTIDPETGLTIRHRFDKLAKIDGKWLGVDLKKTQDIDDYSIAKTINDYSYHVQDSFYSDQFELIAGEQLEGFIFIFVEEKYPHMVAVKQLCDLSRDIGKQKYREDLKLYAEYENGNIVAHNNSGLEIISLPEWVLRQYEDEII